MTLIRKFRRRTASLFYDIGNAVQYYEPQDPTLYDTDRYADVNIYFSVNSAKDYDETTTKVMDVVADLLETREWTAGAKLDTPKVEEE